MVGIFVLSGLGAVATPVESFDHENLSVSFSQPTIRSEEEFVTISIDETNAYIMEQGMPMLPCYNEKFTFPFGTEIKSVTGTPSNIQTQIVSKDVIPTPQAVTVGYANIKNIDETISYGVNTYPSTWFEYDVGTGLVDGNLGVIVDVRVNPIKYHPVDKTVEWAESVDIDIKYEIPTQPVMFEDEYNFVIIAADEYSDELDDLVDHKNNDMGVSTKLVTLSEVYDGTYFTATGRDNQEKIKYFIKNAIENWATGSVLLVGSATKFPTRTVHIYIDLSPDPPDDELFVSDLYYADIYDDEGGFCSWDSNENDVFGEYDWNGNNDEMDLHPDVYLGRLPATSGSQVTAMVDKIETYEDTPAYQEDWFTNLVCIGGDSFPDEDEVDEGELINQKVIDMMDGFVAEKLWVTNGKLTGWTPTGTANIKNAINAGCGFVDFSGHGNTNIWATHPHGNHGTWVPTPGGGIRSSDLQSISSNGKFPIVTVEACSTAKFASDSNSFNWAFLYKANSGAIGTFGATALGWGYIGEYVSEGLIGKMGLDTFRAYKIDDSITLGEMWGKALERFIGSGMDGMDIKTTAEWVLFGDPTLRIAEDSEPPATPDAPDGPTSGGTGTSYTYTASTTDPESDKIYYMFDWGDGSTSGWLGPYNSGSTASGTHTWTSQATYSIRVVAKDEHGKLSAWSDPLSVTMPRSREIQRPFLNFLENHPNLFPLLRQLLGL